MCKIPFALRKRRSSFETGSAVCLEPTSSGQRLPWVRLCWGVVLLPAFLSAHLLAQGSGGRVNLPERGGDPDWRASGRKGLSRSTGPQPRSGTAPPSGVPQSDDEMPETSSPEQDWPAREPRGDRFTDPTESAAGQVWREYNLAPYASRALGVAHPEHAVIDWIIRQTGPETWHGEAVAVLSATRGKLRVYHHPDVQAQVAEIVDRFTRPVQPQVSLRVQLASTTDLNWRSGLVHLLRPVAFGADGQHVWLIAPEDASLLRHRLLLDRGSGPQHIMVQNGQSASFETGKKVNYISSLELLGGAYVSYQPVIGRLHDGLQLTFTPLWTKDGSEVDLGFRLVTRSVQKLHQAMGVAPLTSGTQDALLQVPETVATVMEQSLRMSTSQVLLISAGMQPTDSAARRGPFSMSASVAELLLLVELDPPLSKGMKASRDDYYGR